MKQKISFLYIFLFFSLLGSAYAMLYEYTDEKGVPHVTSNAADVPDKYKEVSRSIADKTMPPPDEAYLARRKASADKTTILANTPKLPVVSPSAPVAASASSPKSANAPKSVEIYVKSWCPYCKQAKSLLDSRGVRYTSYDVETDPSAYNRYVGLGGTGVPVLVIGSQVIHGYSQDQILSALGLS